MNQRKNDGIVSVQLAVKFVIMHVCKQLRCVFVQFFSPAQSCQDLDQEGRAGGRGN